MWRVLCGFDLKGHGDSTSPTQGPRERKSLPRKFRRRVYVILITATGMEIYKSRSDEGPPCPCHISECCLISIQSNRNCFLRQIIHGQDNQPRGSFPTTQFRRLLVGVHKVTQNPVTSRVQRTGNNEQPLNFHSGTIDPRAHWTWTAPGT